MPIGVKVNINDQRRLLSEFNEAAFQIARLNYIWQECNNLASSGKLTEWKWRLDRAWTELSADAREEDGKKIWDEILFKPYKDIPKKYHDTYIYKLKLYNSLISKARIPEMMYNFLQKKEMFLRSLQEDVGKGSKKQKAYSRVM